MTSELKACYLYTIVHVLKWDSFVLAEYFVMISILHFSMINRFEGKIIFNPSKENICNLNAIKYKKYWCCCFESYISSFLEYLSGGENMKSRISLPHFHAEYIERDPCWYGEKAFYLKLHMPINSKVRWCSKAVLWVIIVDARLFCKCARVFNLMT